MRFIVLALAAFTCLGAPARAQETPPLVTSDPRAYAQAFADAMTLTGVRPIREAFVAMIGPGSTLSAEAEQGLRVYENANMAMPATIARIMDDVALSDVYRAVYLYHYFGGNAWVFTRIEFVRIDRERWAVTRVAFGDRWAGVALPTTPGFRAAAPARR